jgi:hypothetical protein
MIRHDVTSFITVFFFEIVVYNYKSTSNRVRCYVHVREECTKRLSYGGTFIREDHDGGSHTVEHTAR